MRRATVILALIGSVCSGCADSTSSDADDVVTTGTPTTLGHAQDSRGETASGGDSTSDDADSDADPSGGDESPATKFDLPDADDHGPGHAERHCGVDILFVIDNSGSMSQHKDDIVAAFGLFVAEMVDTLPAGTWVHVGLTRATGFFDPGNGSGWDHPSCEFIFLDGTWSPPDQHHNGNNGQQGRLYESEGRRFYEFEIGQSPAGLAGWFQYALTHAIALDDASNSESVVAAAAYPFAPVNAEHNAGFLRDKAVLVLFLMSDAPDATPKEIATASLIELVSAAKADCGDGCILPTGIVQSMCYAEPGNTNTRVLDFMHGFGGPPAAIDFFTGNLGPASFTSVLGATLAETIAYTCEFVVPIE
jgi:hypothetical protein